MSAILPGQVIEQSSINGQTVIFRVPRLADVSQLTEYINRLSQEETYIRFSGEEITAEEEKKYVLSLLNSMDKGDAFCIVAEVNGKIVGTSDVKRNQQNLKRGRHVAIFGISLLPEFRGQGIGTELASLILREAALRLPDLKMFQLHVFDENAAGIHIYQKLGFTQVGQIPKAIQHRGALVDEIIMVKAITEDPTKA